MVELVVTGDLKSPALIGVSVRVRLRAPKILEFLCYNKLIDFQKWLK